MQFQVIILNLKERRTKKLSWKSVFSRSTYRTQKVNLCSNTKLVGRRSRTKTTTISRSREKNRIDSMCKTMCSYNNNLTQSAQKNALNMLIYSDFFYIISFFVLAYLRIKCVKKNCGNIQTNAHRMLHYHNHWLDLTW